MPRLVEWAPALAALVAVAAAPPALPRPDYVGLAQRFLPPLDAAYTEKSCGASTAKTPCNAAAELAAAIVALWDVDGNASSAPRASQLMQWFVASWATATANGTRANPDQWDFFACKPIAVAFRGLARLPGGLAGLGWSALDAANARRAAGDVCSPEMRGAWNQAASRAAGTAVALQVWPDLDDASGTWHTYASNVLSDWTTVHGHAENSPVYVSIMWLEMLSLALELDPSAADADVASAAAQNVGRHWRGLMGPGGYIAAFGDAWSGAGGEGGGTLWGFEESLYWPAAFERLAAASGNATEAAFYAHAAASYFFFGTGSAQQASNLCNANGPAPATPTATAFSSRSLHYILLAEQWRRRGGGGGPAAQPQLTTRVTMRRMPPAGVAIPDKLVLTPAVVAGGAEPYVVTELFASSALYHCHVLQVGAVTNFVGRNTTYIHHAGRDSYVAEMASIAVVWRDSAHPAAFPFPAPANVLPQGGEWQLLELPTSNMQPVSQAPPDYWRKNVTQLHWFVSNKVLESFDLDLAYIVLVNPDSDAAIVIDDFEHVDWPAWPNATILADPLAPGPTHKFLRISCPPGKTTNSRPPSTPPLRLDFDARDFPVLRLYYRLGANAPRNDSSIVVLGHGPYTVPEGDFNSLTPLEGSNYDFGAGGIGGGAQYPSVPSFAPIVSAFFPAFASALDEASVVAALSSEGDSFGAFTVRRHYSSGVTWQRALVLLSEGALIVVDTLSVAVGDPADVGGWLAGPSWSLQVREAPALVPGAPNAFDVSGFNLTGCFGAGATTSSERLLVAFFAVGGAGAPNAVVGATPAAFVGGVFVQAPFIRAALASTAPARFVSVLLPHSADDTAPPLAAAIIAGRVEAETVVALPLVGSGSTKATVTVGDDGRLWSVVRE